MFGMREQQGPGVSTTLVSKHSFGAFRKTRPFDHGSPGALVQTEVKLPVGWEGRGSLQRACMGACTTTQQRHVPSMVMKYSTEEGSAKHILFNSQFGALQVVRIGKSTKTSFGGSSR